MKTRTTGDISISGHTLGTPSQTVPQAIELFAAAGLDGAELIWQNDYKSGIPEENNQRVLRDIRVISAETGVSVTGLTPYMSGINSLDESERVRDIERFASCITDAASLDSRIVRVYAGAYIPEQISQHEELWARLVSSLKELAPLADKNGVTLAVENHFNTMTMSAEETVALVQAVDHPAVGILYDQANLTFTHSEPFEEALPLQAGLVRHVHAKDLVFVHRGRPFSATDVATVTGDERSVRSRAVGEGEMDWPRIISGLVAQGYTGAISLEYEYRWHPQDLPEPLVGFRMGAKAGVTTSTQDKSYLKRAALGASERSVLVADSSKFGATSRYRVAELERFDGIITDEALQTISGDIRNSGPNVTTATH